MFQLSVGLLSSSFRSQQGLPVHANHDRRHPLYGGKPITSHRSALVSLQRVRVAFGRVPNRESKGMTKDATLFLDVEEFELKGAFGEAMWGSPVDITSDKNIRDWINGLRQDGGAG